MAILTREQHDRALDHLGSPTAPLLWFERLKGVGGPAGWLMALVKWLLVVVWAVGFVWVWFTVFSVLFLCEGLGFTDHYEHPGGEASAEESKSHG